MTTTREATRRTGTAYGARPVSVDIARGRLARRRPSERRPLRSGSPPRRGCPLTDQVVADRLSLAHWPRGHQIIVCALAGGTGRTTVAGLLATVLAELPYAHIWHPIALVESAPRTLGSHPAALGRRRPRDSSPALARSELHPIGGLGPRRTDVAANSGGTSPRWLSTHPPACRPTCPRSATIRPPRSC